MIIKKFTASTETDAIMLAKEELGKDAIVMNVETSSPKGIYRLFKKTVVEVTAAIDENHQNISEADDSASFLKHLSATPTKEVENNNFNSGFFNTASMYNVEKESAIEQKLNSLQELLEKQMKEKVNEKESVSQNQQKDAPIQKEEKEDKNLECIRLIYNKLIENEVDEKYANQIISDFENKTKKETSLDNILSGIYQKIVLKLGQQKIISTDGDSTRFVFFIGPTGVGKTTTIAKIASAFKLQQKVKVGLITADTYRVAAVEQLRTYANILGIPLKVVYSIDEMKEAQEYFKGYDVVLIDTAGRSHKNEQQKEDIRHLLDTVPEEEKDVFLVLSATTKYRDLIKITESYEEITNYGLIFTKLDETNCVGNIYNIKMKTDAPLSYITYGQNVPDDITQINPQNIAKQMLGGCD